MLIRDLPTPCLLLDVAKLDANVARMAANVAALGVGFRPHAKTAKSIDVMRRVIGPCGSAITVSTLREAEYFFDNGVTDILYAVGMAPVKLDKAAELMRRGCDLGILIEDAVTAGQVSEHGKRAGVRHKVLIEIDSDGHRAGAMAASSELLDIAERLDGVGAELSGVLAHAGSSYHFPGPERIRAVAAKERDAAVLSAEALRRAGFACPIVSVGSTPTLTFSDGLAEVTEGRAGVYMFQDLVMAGIGVCAVEDIAISVMATVIGHHRETGRPIIDAGWNALSADRGTARQAVDQGQGVVCDEAGIIDPELIVVSANQEHGMIGSRAGGAVDRRRFQPGSRVRILPVHACATAALHDAYHAIGADGRVIAQWPRCRGWV